MKIVSYWKNHKEIIKLDNNILIIGEYQHKNKGPRYKTLGIYYQEKKKTIKIVIIQKQTLIMQLHHS